ncbi:MAG: hypothetical protein JRI25_20840, partial [Deltaproteobacteria bacterium]|nr:hypothetical protein [Deltaproteobacteria bacterium]
MDEGGAVLVWGPVIAWMVMWSALLAWHVDDAGITYAYAHNAAEGLGFRAHAAAAPVEGFSNPAWTLVLTGASLLGVKVHVASKVLQCLLGVGTLVLLHRVVLRVGGERSEA